MLLVGIASFVVNSKIVIPEKRLALCRDEKDNMMLECCFAADADFLITGDKDILEMENIELKTEVPKLRIVSPRGYLERGDSNYIGT